MSLKIPDDQFYADVNHYCGVLAPSKQPIQYIDLAPRPIKVQIPLVEFFERIKRVRADKWQIHFCDYLQSVVENRHVKGSFDEFHAEPQLGKTAILSQTFPAWCYGHDPFWRSVLAMYNISRSEAHSEVIIQIMRSQVYREIFPNKGSHLPNTLSKSAWNTNARMDVEQGRTDGQKSFNAVGLQSGITGSSADWYTIDDPYKDPGEAWSEAVRTNLERFWKYGIEPRLTPYSCIAAMFHRYSYDDFGGYLLNTGQFNYIRYATVADGPYVHDDTGQSFPDPLDRKEGEYISERRPPSYYTDKRKDPRVWNSMFQGRPSSEEGDFFRVGKMQKVEVADLEAERAKCVLWVRAWDNAATQGAGDHTAGAKMAIQPDGTILIDNVKLAQLEASARLEMQKATAMTDGVDVPVGIPKEQAEAGKSLVFFTEEYLRGFTVVSRSVTNSALPGSNAKARRAYNYSIAVNSGQVKYASDDNLPENEKWNTIVLRAMRNFLFSDFDDPIDAMSDGYNHLHETLVKGLLITNYRPQRNLFPYSAFAQRFRLESQNGNGSNGHQPTLKVPQNFMVYFGVKISSDASYPTSGIMAARAPENANLGETIFTITEYKAYDGDVYKLFEWVRQSIEDHCEKTEGKPAHRMIWLHPDSEQFDKTIVQKIGLPVHTFEGDSTTGFAELNWYFMPTQDAHPVSHMENASRLYALVPDDQFSEPIDDAGLPSLRQELATCGYNDKGEPTKTVAVLDCLRMCVAGFRMIATRLRADERAELKIAPKFRLDTINQQKDEISEHEYGQLLITRQAKLTLKKMFNGKPKPTSRFDKFKK